MSDTRPRIYLLLSLLSVSLSLAIAAGWPARADDAPAAGEKPAKAEKEDKELDPAKVKAAIDKGVAWLKTQQKPDGRFDDGYMSEFPLGPTALAGMALTKCVGRGDPAVAKAYANLDPKLLKRTYDVGIVAMAIEALYAPHEEDYAASELTYSQLVRKAFGKGAPAHRELAAQGADFLVKTQHKEIWGYPFEQEEDLSNAQYALLGIGAARRLGVSVPTPGLTKALEHFLRVQETDGPEVPEFTVPAADHSAKEIEELAVALRKTKNRDSGGLTEIRKFYDTATREKLHARGFAYKSEGDGGRGGGGGGGGRRGGGGGGRGGRMHNADLSMTTAGLACLVTLKWALENTPGFPAKKTDSAIRDAAAYVAKNFSLQSSEKHPYYVLYGIERAGAMTGCPFFGEHDWYVEGGEWILSHQNADGSWGEKGPVSKPIGEPETSVPDTCFALLFLKRASVPLVPPIPKRVISGMK